MKVLIAAALMMTAAGAEAQTFTQQYPSCDLKAQHALKGDVGGSIKDPRQDHISVRATILQADLGSMRKAGRLTQATADGLWKRVEAVRGGTDRYTREQGFLSAAEVASYDRALDTVAKQACRR